MRVRKWIGPIFLAAMVIVWFLDEVVPWITELCQ